MTTLIRSLLAPPPAGGRTRCCPERSARCRLRSPGRLRALRVVLDVPAERAGEHGRGVQRRRGRWGMADETVRAAAAPQRRRQTRRPRRRPPPRRRTPRRTGRRPVPRRDESRAAAAPWGGTGVRRRGAARGGWRDGDGGIGAARPAPRGPAAWGRARGGAGGRPGSVRSAWSRPARRSSARPRGRRRRACTIRPRSHPRRAGRAGAAAVEPFTRVPFAEPVSSMKNTPPGPRAIRA